jgi:hypothetical protein
MSGKSIVHQYDLKDRHLHGFGDGDRRRRPAEKKEQRQQTIMPYYIQYC